MAAPHAKSARVYRAHTVNNTLQLPRHGLENFEAFAPEKSGKLTHAHLRLLVLAHVARHLDRSLASFKRQADEERRAIRI